MYPLVCTVIYEIIKLQKREFYQLESGMGEGISEGFQVSFTRTQTDPIYGCLFKISFL